MEKEYLSRIKDWRNAQIEVLRQTKLLTDHDQEEWFRRISHDDRQVVFAIKESDTRNDPLLIGYCGITNIDFQESKGEISFLMDDKRAKNDKLYREDFLSVLYMLCLDGFERFKLDKLYTETYIFRVYHIAILEKFGLQKNGILKDRKIINERHWDSVIHFISNDEWAEIKRRIRSELEK